MRPAAFLFFITLGAFAAFFSVPAAHAQSTATTTLHISICGNGIVDYGEACDDGVNNGDYATSSASKNCLPDCSGFGPYCGDSILQEAYGEQCDDGNNTSEDGCSATCQIESVAPLPGPGPVPQSSGGAFPGGSFTASNPTKVIIEGKAYPGASVNILKDGAVLGVVQADTSANFYFTTTNVTPGVTTFDIWAQDSSGLKSIALTTTLTLTANAATTISGEFLPPTINVSSRQLKKGDTIVISGQAVPSVTVESYIHSSNQITLTTSSDSSGNWKMSYNTQPLQNNQFHTVSADFVTTENGITERSTVSQAISFYLGTGKASSQALSDLNGDNKVNLADFSILLYYWGTSSPLADLNSDGKVDLTDLSILLFNWTG